MEEVWKPVVGFESRYEVSDLGRIRSLPHETLIERKKGKPYILKKRGAYLEPQPRRHGYMSVWLYGNGGNNGRAGKQYSVHRIVAEAFIPNPTGYAEVNHINENKSDNRACNLEWCTHKENSNHGTRAERIAEFHRNDSNKKRRPIAQYTLDGELVCTFPSIYEVRKSGYNGGNAWECAKGNPSYSHSQGYLWRFV